jgi:hypothetical protein
VGRVLVRVLPDDGWVARSRVDQLQDFPCLVEDAHAETADLLGAPRAGLGRNVGPAEAVCGPFIEPGQGGGDKLRHCLSLGFLSVARLWLKGAMDGVGELVEEDVPVFGGEGDGLGGVVCHPVDVVCEAIVLHPHAKPGGDFHERRRISGGIGRKFQALGVLVPEDGDCPKAYEDLLRLVRIVVFLDGVVLLLPDDDGPEDVEGPASVTHLAIGFLPLSVSPRVGRPREEHQELVAGGPPRARFLWGVDQGLGAEVRKLCRREEPDDFLQLGVGSLPPRCCLVDGSRWVFSRLHEYSRPPTRDVR